MEDLRALEDNNMLHVNLLDFILHLTCMHYNDANGINYCLGGTVARQLFPRMLMPISNPNANQNNLKMCRTFDRFDKGKHQLIITDIDDSHYNVIDVMIDDNSENFITKVSYYDLMTTPATKVARERQLHHESKNSFQT